MSWRRGDGAPGRIRRVRGFVPHPRTPAPVVVPGAPREGASRPRRSAPGRTRTCDLEIRRLLLYPAELRGPGTRRPDAAASLGAREHGPMAPHPPRGRRASTSWRGPVTALAGQVRRDDRDVARPSTPVRGTCPGRAPTGWRRPAGGAAPASRAGRNGPALGRRPDDGAGRPHRPRQGPSASPPDSPAKSTRARVTSGKHPPPASASDIGAVRAAAAATPSTRSSTTRSGAAPMNASVTCHWCAADQRRSPPASRRTSRKSSRSSATCSGRSTETKRRTAPSSPVLDRARPRRAPANGRSTVPGSLGLTA